MPNKEAQVLCATLALQGELPLNDSAGLDTRIEIAQAALSGVAEPITTLLREGAARRRAGGDVAAAAFLESMVASLGFDSPGSIQEAIERKAASSAAQAEVDEELSLLISEAVDVIDPKMFKTSDVSADGAMVAVFAEGSRIGAALVSPDGKGACSISFPAGKLKVAHARHREALADGLRRLGFKVST